MNANAIALDALKAAKRAINSMKVEAETAGAGGDQQMLQDACETISNEGLAASTALDKAIAALEAEPQGWRDIASAPKDGLFQDGNNHYAEYILAWHPGSSRPYRARWWFRDDNDASNFLADGGYAVFPTVFQPLPTPPKD